MHQWPPVLLPHQTGQPGAATAAGKAPAGCRNSGGDTHSPRGQAGAVPPGRAAGPVPGAGSGLSRGTGGLSPLCFCLCPARGGDGIRARGWGMDVGQQQTDGDKGLAPPACARLGWGQAPHTCSLPLPVQQAGDCGHLAALSTPSPVAVMWGTEPPTPFACMGRGAPRSQDPGHLCPFCVGSPTARLAHRPRLHPSGTAWRGPTLPHPFTQTFKLPSEIAPHNLLAQTRGPAWRSKSPGRGLGRSGSCLLLLRPA